MMVGAGLEQFGGILRRDEVATVGHRGLNRNVGKRAFQNQPTAHRGAEYHRRKLQSLPNGHRRELRPQQEQLVVVGIPSGNIAQLFRLAKVFEQASLPLLPNYFGRWFDVGSTGDVLGNEWAKVRCRAAGAKSYRCHLIL
nr:hypothetical protein [Pirellula staleyi]